MKRLISILTAVLVFVSSFNMLIATADETASVSREADIISKLNIYNAEDENKNITYGEMLSAFVHISGLNMGKAEKIYYDIEVGDPLAVDVTTAYYTGLVTVPKGAPLRPGRTVSYEETMKMAARVLGYGSLADENYTSILSKMKHINRLKVSDYSALTQGDTVRILFKMLDEELVEFSKDKYAVGTGKTVLDGCLHLEKITGVVNSTSVSSVDGEKQLGKNRIIIDGTGYYANGIDNAEDYLGCRVEAYIKEDTNGDYEFLYFGTYRTTVKVINDIDIEDISANEITYLENNRITHEKLSGTEDIIYNYVASPTLDLTSLYKNKFDGYFELIDNDSDDVTDVIKVYSYRNYTLKSYDGKNKIITDENRGVLDFTDYDNVIFQKPDGTKPEIEDFAGNAVISVFDSGNKEYAKIIVNNEDAVGLVNGKDIENNIILIDSVEYYTDKDFFETYDSCLRNGKISVLLDYRGKVSAIASEVSESGFKWGYLCGINKKNDLSETIRVKIFDTDGNMNTLELYKRVYLDGVLKDADKVYDFFTDTDAATGKKYCLRQFVRFSVNKSGYVTDIDSPVQTEFENDECNNSVTIEDKFTATDDYTFFAKANYAIAKNVKIMVIPASSTGNEADNKGFDDSDYYIVSGARTFFHRSSLTLKLQLADIDKCNIAGLVAVEEVDYKTYPYGGVEVEKSNKMREYMVDEICWGLDEDGNMCPMLKYFSQRDNNTMQKAMADSIEVFMKPVYDANGKVVSGEYRQFSRGDVVRLKFDYNQKKVIGTAVDFDIDRTDNGRFKQNTYYAIGIAKAKSGVGLRVAYKTNTGAPDFDGHNADEVFDLTVGKNVKISSILANGYITVYDKKQDKIFSGDYYDLIDYSTSPDDLPIIVSRCRNNNELALFVIR